MLAEQARLAARRLGLGPATQPAAPEPVEAMSFPADHFSFGPVAEVDTEGPTPRPATFDVELLADDELAELLEEFDLAEPELLVSELTASEPIAPEPPGDPWENATPLPRSMPAGVLSWGEPPVATRDGRRRPPRDYMSADATPTPGLAGDR